MKEYNINLTNQFLEELNDKEKDIQKLTINKFVIIYNVDNINNQVYILHIFSEKQDYFNLI